VCVVCAVHKKRLKRMASASALQNHISYSGATLSVLLITRFPSSSHVVSCVGFAPSPSN
jgi:hypothetical protein